MKSNKNISRFTDCAQIFGYESPQHREYKIHRRNRAHETHEHTHTGTTIEKRQQTFHLI